MSNRFTRTISVAPSALLLFYAACRWLDGRDGSHGLGVWWNVGHVAFLLVWVCFATLVVLMAVRVRDAGGFIVAASSVVALLGVCAFCWVVLTDLFQNWPEPPDVLKDVGPVLFLLGFVLLLGMTARRREGALWVAYPLLAVIGLVTVAASITLLPITALLFLIALIPCRGLHADRTHRAAASLG